MPPRPVREGRCQVLNKDVHIPQIFHAMDPYALQHWAFLTHQEPTACDPDGTTRASIQGIHGPRYRAPYTKASSKCGQSKGWFQKEKKNVIEIVPWACSLVQLRVPDHWKICKASESLHEQSDKSVMDEETDEEMIVWQVPVKAGCRRHCTEGLP